ncbi:MAG: type II toxin-antitoxin system HicA family toxin [Burkholderiales bacterium]|nr:type II toxin-antitoxin system HicA family toxin [Burkholderiales bacterium]
MSAPYGASRDASHPGTVTVSGKPSTDVPPGTFNSVLKQAGLKSEVACSI